MVSKRFEPKNFRQRASSVLNVQSASKFQHLYNSQQVKKDTTKHKFSLHKKRLLDLFLIKSFRSRTHY